jgi:anti-sigma regulatory factor (Ser/Thr protein kinase)
VNVASGHAHASQRTNWPLISALPPLAPFVSVPKVARAHLGVMLTHWQLAPLAEDGEVVVSELATNAVNASMAEDGNPRYIGGWRMPVVTLRLLSDGVQVLVEMHDQAPGQPLPLGAGGDAEGGRGLALVAALSARWGWHPVPGGKCVWAVLSKDA